MASFFMMQLAQWAPSLLLSVRGLGIPHEPSLAVGSSIGRPLLPGSLGGGVTHQAISSAFVDDVGSDLVL